MLSGALTAQTPDTNMLIPLVDELNPNLERVLNHHLNVSKSRLRWSPHKYNILIYIFPDQDVINCLSEKVIDSIYKVNDFRRIKTLNSYCILAETVKKDDVELANIPRFKTICLYQFPRHNKKFVGHG